MRILILILVIFIQISSSYASHVDSWRGVLIHHTAGDSLDLETCNSIHRARGWDMCGYSFVINKDGTIWESRGWHKSGAHAGNAENNRKYLGIAFVGTNKATDEQLKAFKDLYLEITRRFGKLPIKGHNEMKATKCPGLITHQISSYLHA